MFTIKLKQANKIIVDEKNHVCFHSSSYKYSPSAISDILNNIYAPVLLMVLLKQRYLSERSE